MLGICQIQGASFRVWGSWCKVEAVRIQYECFGGDFFILVWLFLHVLRVLMHCRHCSWATVVERRYDPWQWLLKSLPASDLTTDWVWHWVHCLILQKGYLGLSSRVWLFSAVWIWRESKADLCLQFHDGGEKRLPLSK